MHGAWMAIHFLFISFLFPIHFLFNSYLFPIHSYSSPIQFWCFSYSIQIMSHSFQNHFPFIPDHFLLIFVPLSFPKFFKNVIRKWNEVNGKESNSSEWSNPESPIQNPVHTRITFSNTWSVAHKDSLHNQLNNFISYPPIVEGGVTNHVPTWIMHIMPQGIGFISSHRHSSETTKGQNACESVEVNLVLWILSLRRSSFSKEFLDGFCWTDRSLQTCRLHVRDLEVLGSNLVLPRWGRLQFQCCSFP